MTLPAIFRRVAQSEYDVAHDFFPRKSARTAAKFARAIDDALDEIVANPQRFPIADLDVREAPVAGFPYAIYYVVEPHRIDILSVFHLSRDPSVWQGRR